MQCWLEVDITWLRVCDDGAMTLTLGGGGKHVGAQVAPRFWKS